MVDTISQSLMKPSRRSVLVGTGALAAAAALPFGRAFAQEDTIRIGFIGALSGIRASFGASTLYTIDQIKAATANGIEIDGKTYKVEIIVKDDQSTPTRSLQVGN